MADKITFPWVWHKDLQPMEWLQYIADSFLELADLWDEYNSHYFEEQFEFYKTECHGISKIGMYRDISHGLHCQDFTLFHAYRFDSMDVSKEIEYLRENVLKAFENSVIFPNLLKAIGIIEYVMRLGESSSEEFEYDICYSAFSSSEQVSETHGEEAAKRFKKEVELTEDDYENAFESITELLEKIEKGRFSEKLRGSALAIKGYCKLKVGSKKYAETEDKRPITLIQFMRKNCEQQKIQLLRCRRKSLNDAHFRKSITLPEPIRKWKTGQAKYYNPSDLKQKWSSYCDILPNLPPLKQ